MDKRKIIILSGGDTIRPTVAITSTESSPTAASPVPFAFTLSEPSIDFTIDDITISGTANATLDNFAGSGVNYTVDATPANSGTILIDVAADSFHDAAGNGNTAATQYSITALVYIFRDEFITADAAPLTTPRTNEPGPGEWDVTEAVGSAEIASGTLILTSTAGGGPNLAGRAGYGNADGLAFIVDRVSGIIESGFGFANFANLADGRININFRLNGIAQAGGTGIYTTVAATQLGLCDTYAVVFGGVSGQLGVIKWIGKTGSTWKLLYTATGIVRADLTAYLVAANNAGVTVVDNAWITKLGTDWQSGYGIATDYVASPSSGETITSVADCVLEFMWTAATDEVVDFQFRRTDDDNCWIVRCDQAGSRMYLYEKNSGTETEYGATGGVAQTFTNGTAYHIEIVADTQLINVYANNGARKITYTSASFNQTATGAKITGFTTGSDFASWPREVTPF